MARIYQPLQRQSDKRWDMTVSSDEERWTHAEGFCAGTFEKQWPDWPEGETPERLRFWMSREYYLARREEHRPHAAHYHDDGHATAEEASACYERFGRLVERRDVVDENEQRKCQVCSAWTTHRVLIGHSIHQELVLCPAHQSDADVEAALAKERTK